MADYVINPKEHDQGGINVPYEKYHQTLAQTTVATRRTTALLNGLMSPTLAKAVEYTDVPASMSTTGESGQRAI